MCDAIIEVARKGGFHAAMMLRINVSKKTFYKYAAEIPEFAKALEQADLIILARQEEIAMLGMTGQLPKYNFAANAFILSNKYRSLYPRSGSGDVTEVTINNLNLTPEELQNKIAQKLEKFRTLGIELPALPNHSQEQIIDYDSE